MTTIIQDFSIWLSLQHLIEFDSYLEPWISFWPMQLVFPYFIYLTPHRLCHRIDKALIYKSEGHFDYGIYLYLIYLSKYKIIVFEHHLLSSNELSIERNQIFSLINLSVLSLVLVRVYWLDHKGLPLICH